MNEIIERMKDTFIDERVEEITSIEYVASIHTPEMTLFERSLLKLLCTFAKMVLVIAMKHL